MRRSSFSTRALSIHPPVSGVFLLGSCHWNQSAAADEAIARVSEVVDWEEGGRTALHHVDRIFDKEKEDGERRVLAVMRRVSLGRGASPWRPCVLS